MEQVYKINVKAPRFTFKSIRCLGDSNFFKKFLKKHPEHEGKITARIFTQIVKTFNRLLWQEVIKNRYGADLPQRLGRFVMKSFPKKKDFYDRGVLYREGKIVQEKNAPTDGKMLKICFINSDNKYNYTNKNLWYFDPERKFAQEASKAFITNSSHYEHVDNSRYEVKAREKKIKSINYAIRKQEDFLLTYDEFAFD